MANITAARAIRSYGKDSPPVREVGVAASTVLYHGGMVGLSSGSLVPASQSVAAIGVIDIQAWDDQTKTGQSEGSTPSTWPNKIDNSAGNAGDRKALVRQGIYAMDNKGADPVVLADVGSTCYVEDDHTVRHTSSGSVAAGKVMGLTEDGLVLVKFSV